MRSENTEEAVRTELARLTGTNARDWHLVFKARYGMQVAFDEVAKSRGEGEVLTQAFTCLTAVEPIVASGLRPRYVDIEESTVMIDPTLVTFDDLSRALVIQHTFGIMAEQKSRVLAAKTLDADVVLMEDSAHCLGQMTRDQDGQPVADISIHSFGVEKLLPTRFGGAVYVNPSMRDIELRDSIRRRLETLPRVSRKLSTVARVYALQNAVFNRLPAPAAQPVRAAFEAVGLFEAPISQSELSGQLPLKPAKPSEWMLRAMLGNLKRIEAIRRTRRAAVRTYLRNATGAGATVPSEVSSNEPLVRFPLFARTQPAAERAIAAVRAAGFFGGHWYRPLLFPGTADASLGFASTGTDLPVTRSLAARALNFQTGTSPEVCKRTAEVAMASLSPNRERAPDLGNEDFVVVFLGTGLGTYALARELHEEYGIRSIALGRAALDETADSRIVDVRAHSSFGNPEFVVESLLELAQELGDRKIVLIPAIEFYTNVVAENRAVLDKHFLVPLPPKDLVTKLIDKRTFYEVCEDIGLPFPEAVFVTKEQHRQGWNAAEIGMHAPLIVKPADTDAYQRCVFEGRKKVYRASSLDEVGRIVDLIYGSSYEGDLVIQQYMSGGEEVMRVANCYSTKAGEVTFVSPGQVVLTEPDPNLVGNNNAIATISEPKLAENLKRFLETVGYVGLANFDLMLDPDTGEYKALEANLRAGATSFYTMAGGGNLAKHVIEDLVYDRPLPLEITDKEGLWVNVPAPVLSFYAKNELKERFKKARKAGVLHTLDYGPDHSLRRLLRRFRCSLRRSLAYARYGRSHLNN